MHSAPQSVCSTLPASVELPQSRQREDLAYQAMTIAAILLVLMTVWVF